MTFSQTAKKSQNIWATFVTKCLDKNFQKSPNLVTRVSTYFLSTSSESWEWVIKHFHASKKCRFFFKKAKKGFMFVQARNITIHMRSRKNIKKEICDKRKNKNFNFQFYFIPTETSGTPWTCLSPPPLFRSVAAPRVVSRNHSYVTFSFPLSLSPTLSHTIPHSTFTPSLSLLLSLHTHSHPLFPSLYSLTFTLCLSLSISSLPPSQPPSLSLSLPILVTATFCSSSIWHFQAERKTGIPYR